MTLEGDLDGYFYCVVCGHEKVAKEDWDEHEQSQDHRDFDALNWYQHQLSLRGWTVKKLLTVQARLRAKKDARKKEGKSQHE